MRIPPVGLLEIDCRRDGCVIPLDSTAVRLWHRPLPMGSPRNYHGILTYSLISLRSR